MRSPDSDTEVIAPPWWHFRAVVDKFRTQPLTWLRLLVSWLAIRGMHMLGRLAGVPYVHVVNTNPLIVMFSSIESLESKVVTERTSRPFPLKVERTKKWSVGQ